jgi:hypothetical protein
MFSRPSNRPSPPLHRPHPYSLSRPRHLRNRSKPNLPGRHPLVTRPAVRRLLKRRLKQHRRRHHHHNWPRLRRSLNRPPPAKPSRNRPKCLRLGSSVPLPRRIPARHRQVNNRGAGVNLRRTSRVLGKPAAASPPRASLRAANLRVASRAPVHRPAVSPRDVSPRRVVKVALVKAVRVRAPRPSHPPEQLAHVVPLVRRPPRSRRLGAAGRQRA